MRFVISIFLSMLFLAAVHAQDPKPRIVGQKDLSVQQGQSIVIQLTDLYVEETQENDNDNGGGNGDDDEEEDEEDEDGEDRDDVEDDDDKGKDKGGGKGNDDDKKDKEDGKDKGKGKGKGKGNGRASYPDGYVLEIFTGNNYTFSGNTVTPAASFRGMLTVPVRVKNSDHASPKFDLRISVLPVTPTNVRPAITAQSALSTPMNTALEIKLSHLTVTDPDNRYPDDFSLTVGPGENYTISGKSTVVPRTGFVGILKVTVTVNDGKVSSDAFNLTISVTGTAPVANVAPKISGQLPISISVNQSVTIVLTHLLVTDPDNNFPADFTVKVFPGSGYSVNNTTVTPPAGFSGVMLVAVSVSDGKAESSPYNFKINVNPIVNSKPVVTGQAGIKILQGQSLVVNLSQLVVEDDDDDYPEGFRLTVHEGSNYSVSGATITPAQDFLGTLKVNVSVNDGKASSDQFQLHVEVVSAGRLEVLGQRSIELSEDSSIVIRMQDLIVNDPSQSYPQNFVLKILPGENYKVNDHTIEPHENFFGNLILPVTVSKGNVTSEIFDLLVVVHPVNDAPELLNFENEPIEVSGNGSWSLFEGVNAEDVDDTHLVYAEISLNESDYNESTDYFEYDPSDSVHVVFDRQTGTLFMVGRASLAEYSAVLKSVKFGYEINPDSVTVLDSKTVRAQLSDGKTASEIYERMLTFETDPGLEIPTAFTPNNDNANDTWKITPAKKPAANTFVRVYDKKGHMVFESQTLETEWDGHFNGSPLPPDVYFYTIEMDLSYRKVSYKGIVSILR